MIELQSNVEQRLTHGWLFELPTFSSLCVALAAFTFFSRQTGFVSCCSRKFLILRIFSFLLPTRSTAAAFSSFSLRVFLFFGSFVVLLLVHHLASAPSTLRCHSVIRSFASRLLSNASRLTAVFNRISHLISPLLRTSRNFLPQLLRYRISCVAHHGSHTHHQILE